MHKEKRIINGQEVTVTVCDPATDDNVHFQNYAMDSYLGESPGVHKAAELEINENGRKTLTAIFGEALTEAKHLLRQETINE